MSENEQHEMDASKVELPPGFQRFRSDLEAARRKLLKEKVPNSNRPVFADPEQLRQFIAQYMYPAMISMVETFGAAFVDMYGMNMSNSRDIVGLRRWASRNFRAAGLDVEDESGGISITLLNELIQDHFALGSVIQKKLPGDEETMAIYNTVGAKLVELLGQAQAQDEEDDEEDDDEEDDEEDDDDDEEEDEEKKEGDDEKKEETAASLPATPEDGAAS
jgi:hypothetical protein